MVFDNSESRYDLIVGRDILQHGFIIDYKAKQALWDELSIPIIEAFHPHLEIGTHFTSATLER